MMPLSTVVSCLKRPEGRRHAERMPRPDDGRSFLIRLTPEDELLLGLARAVAVAVLSTPTREAVRA